MTGSEGLGEEGGAGRVGMRNTILSGEVHCVVEKEKKISVTVVRFLVCLPACLQSVGQRDGGGGCVEDDYLQCIIMAKMIC